MLSARIILPVVGALLLVVAGGTYAAFGNDRPEAPVCGAEPDRPSADPPRSMLVGPEDRAIVCQDVLVRVGLPRAELANSALRFFLTIESSGHCYPSQRVRAGSTENYPVLAVRIGSDQIDLHSKREHLVRLHRMPETEVEKIFAEMETLKAQGKWRGGMDCSRFSSPVDWRTYCRYDVRPAKTCAGRTWKSDRPQSAVR